MTMIFSRLKTRHILFLTAAITAFAGTSFAQSDKIAPTIREFVPRVVTVSLLRQNDKSGEAFIRLRTPVGASGCPRVTPLRYTLETDAPIFLVNVEGYSLDFSSMSRSPQYSCKTANQYALADIPLDRKLVEDNRLTKIRFTLGKGMGSDTYKITLDKNTLSILPDSENIFDAGKMPTGGQTALLHWYYPANTLVLTAPTVPEGQQDQAIADFANTHGMTKVETVIPQFVMPSGQAHRHYYVDDAGKTIAMVPNHDNVAVSETVSARRPGTFE
ncbi:MAG: hypothetical protein JWO78_415 [Micavibrio sp.]|nr:hypothetical protein [Micavibrio sp.]